MSASGARKVRIGLNYGAHAMGTCRMGSDSRASVVNEFCQSHDVKNLFVCDTSLFVTGAGVNPTLTAMAIARRATEHIAQAAAKGVEFVSEPKDQFYGVEAVFKDPFGNWFSMTQPKSY